MSDYKKHSGTYSPLTSVVLKTILEILDLEKKGWNGPNITVSHKTYKLDWYSPDYDQTGDYITVYDDGVVQLYQDDEVKQIKISPLHFRTWMDKIIENGGLGSQAVFAIDFFKELKK